MMMMPTKLTVLLAVVGWNSAIASSCMPGSEIVLDENFELYTDSSQLSGAGWANGMLEPNGGPVFGKFLRSHESSQAPSVKYEVPADADYLMLSFDFYEIDHWSIHDHFSFYINGEQIPLDSFDDQVGEKYKTGWTRRGIKWVADTTSGYPNNNTMTSLGFGDAHDQIHHVRAKIPQDLYSYGDITIKFVAQIDGSDDEASGVDNIQIEAFYECGACEEERVIDSGNFESSWSSSVVGWINPKTATDDDFTTFLGPYTSDDSDFQDDPVKFYFIPDGAETIRIKFDFYEIDQWELADGLYAYVNGIEILLGIFNHEIDEGRQEGDVKRGIRWTSQSQSSPRQIGGSPNVLDQIHHITIDVPRKGVFKDGLLELRLSTRLSDASHNAAAGFDNLKIVSSFTCEQTAVLEDDTPLPEDELVDLHSPVNPSPFEAPVCDGSPASSMVAPTLTTAKPPSGMYVDASSFSFFASDGVCTQ